MIFIFVIILLIIIFLINYNRKKEDFYQNEEAITGALSLVDSMNGYVYLVGGNMGGSHKRPGFKESELESIINEYDRHDKKTADRYRKIYKDGKISNENMVPFIFAATKEMNTNYSKIIEEMNDIRTTLQPIRENMQQIKSCMIMLDTNEKCTGLDRKDFNTDVQPNY